MSTRRATRGLGNPALVGAVTVLVAIAGVALAYSANAGLPFTPTYELSVTVPDASGLVPRNEVRIGGARAGVVDRIDALPRRSGPPVARVALRLDAGLEPLAAGTRVAVRQRSPLGLRYLELRPGGGAPVPDGGGLPLSAARPGVDLDELLNALDGPARDGARTVIDALGTGTAGRGAAVNQVVDGAPALFAHAGSVAETVAAQDRDLRRLIAGLEGTTVALASSPRRLGTLIEHADRTAGAVAAQPSALASTLEEAAPTEAAAIDALAALRDLLPGARSLVHHARPAGRRLPQALERLQRALDRGAPSLRRAAPVLERAGDAFAALERLAREEHLAPALSRLDRGLTSLEPTLRHVGPFQTRCNYLGVWMRNITSMLSQGDAGGAWFRAVILRRLGEMLPAERPASELHANPYPATAAPGQDGECEAGNEPYEPGRSIGNAPGNQGGRTDATPGGGARR